jgi:hypothetical protein
LVDIAEPTLEGVCCCGDDLDCDSDSRLCPAPLLAALLGGVGVLNQVNFGKEKPNDGIFKNDRDSLGAGAAAPNDVNSKLGVVVEGLLMLLAVVSAEMPWPLDVFGCCVASLGVVRSCVVVCSSVVIMLDVASEGGGGVSLLLLLLLLLLVVVVVVVVVVA